MRGIFQGIIDGCVKSPPAVFRVTGKWLDVRKVRLALYRLARLAYETFYKAVLINRIENLANLKKKQTFD